MKKSTTNKRNHCGSSVLAQRSPQPDDPTASQWIDVSVPLRDCMVHWPSDPPVRIRRVSDIDRGDSHTLSELSMGSHAGTHVDAPLHFIRQGLGVDEMPLDIAVGHARVVEIRDPESIKPEELEPLRIRRGERILLKTKNSPRVWQTNAFVEDFVFVSDEAAEYLVKRGVVLVGIDYLSVGGYKHDGGNIHHTLLSNGIWIIEGLNLSGVKAGDYDLVCLPLRLERGDGSPARVILKPLKA